MDNKRTGNNLKDIIYKFLNTTTAHGYSKLGEPSSNFRRLIWFCIMLVIWSLAFFFISYNIHEYFKYSVITSFQLINPYFSEFPAVMICNYTEIISCKFNDIDCYHQIFEMDGCAYFNTGKIIYFLNDINVAEY